MLKPPNIGLSWRCIFMIINNLSTHFQKKVMFENFSVCMLPKLRRDFRTDFFAYGNFLWGFSLVIFDSKFFWASQIHVKSHERKSVGGTIEIMCDRGNCGKTFRRQSELIDHLNLHDNFLQKCYFCPWGAPPGQTNSIKTHLNQHIGQANMKCSYCDKKFFSKETSWRSYRSKTWNCSR